MKFTPALKAALIVITTCVIVSNPAFALAGLDKGTTLINDIKTWVISICAAVGTIMCCIAAFKIWSGSKTFDEMSGLLIGALVLIVGPAAIAALVPTT